MTIKYLDLHPHTGGLFTVTAVVGGDVKTLTEARLKPEDYELTCKKKSKKRSLDANGYYWVLLQKLARVLRTSDEELHRIMLNDYGAFRMTEDGEIVRFTLRKGIDPINVCKYSKILATGQIKGVDAVQYGVLKGSSEMTSTEFAALLDGLISECKEMGIETLSPEELEQIRGQANETHH